MPEHPDIVIEDALDGLWAAIREQHPDLPAVPVRVLDLLDHRALFVPSAMTIYVGRWLVEEGRWCTISATSIARMVLEVLLHEAAHVWLCLRGAESLDSGRRSYHNTLFRDAAVLVGLIPPKQPDERRGYANCVLTRETVDAYADALRRYAEAMPTAEVIPGIAD